MTRRLFQTALFSVLLLPLLSCASSVSTESNDIRVTRDIAALDARVLDGGEFPAEILEEYADIYEDHDTSPAAIAGYADALRRAGQVKEALNIIQPAVSGKNPTSIDGKVFSAYMRLMLGTGYYRDAEKRITARLVRANGTAEKAELNHLLGIALVGQKRRAEAIQAFRRAVSGWSGRPGVVQENLKKLGISQDIKTGF
jgi:tetratricopeptide (TPR) repeat protein